MIRSRSVLPPRLRRYLGAALALSLLAPVGAGAQTGLQEQLEQARKKVKAIQKELDVAQARQQALRVDIESLTRQIAQAYAQKLLIEDQIKQTKDGVKESTEEIGVLQKRLNERARDAYIRGPGGVLEAVLEARSLADLTDRVTFVDILSQSDANLATGLDTERDQLKTFKGTLVDLRKAQNRLLKGLRGRQEELQGKQQQQQAVAAEIEEKLAEAKKVVSKLQAKWQRQLLARISFAGSKPGPDIDGKPGPLYACPVDPPRSYIDDFGYPRPGGRTHQGNDILAPKGTRIRAPFDGRAVEGSNSLGGLTVHVYGSQGYVYNAHLSRYAGVSGSVKAGQVIGFVGNTGNAIGGPYHDHFEWHPGNGSAISPYHYLNEVCGVGGG